MKKLLFLFSLILVGVFIVSTAVGADLVIMKNGLRHDCTVIEDDPDEDNIIVRVVYGDGKSGTVSIPRKNIKEIQYSFASRLAKLKPDDFKGKYDLAMYAITQGMNEEAFSLLKECAGKKGVPSDAWLKLAKMYLEKKQTKEAIAALEKYVAANPEDKKAKAALDLLKKSVEVSKTPATSTTAKQLSPSPKTPVASPKNTVKVRLLEGLEAKPDWKVAAWAGSGAVEKRNDAGNSILAFNYDDPGNHLKSCCYYIIDKPVDAKTNRYFNISAMNNNDKGIQFSLALSVGTSPNQLKYFETPLKILPSKKWLTMSFDLQKANWKTKPKWKHNETIPNEKIWAIWLVVYPSRNNGTIYFDDISFKSEENEL